jgi:ferredoxin
VRVRVDREFCTGHGRCYSLVPELFEDDDQGNGQARGAGHVSGDQLVYAQRAVQVCPEGAVVLEED